jgi:hypothetical protein
MSSRVGGGRAVALPSAAMDLVLATKVWHYWLSFFIVGTVVLVFIAFGIGYLVKVTSNRFPRQ